MQRRTPRWEDSAPAHNAPFAASRSSTTALPGLDPVPVQKEALIVLVRHGKPQNNKLSLSSPGRATCPSSGEMPRRPRGPGRRSGSTKSTSKWCTIAWTETGEMNCL